MSINQYRTIKKLVMSQLALKGDLTSGKNLSKEEIEKIYAEQIEKIYRQNDGYDLDENYLDKLISDLSTKFGVKEENSIKQFSAHEVDHEEWDNENKVYEIDNHPAWTSFYDYFSEKFPLTVLNDLNRNSSKILFKLEDPNRGGSWSSKGLVIGEVQSGKTMNMLALVNKSIAAGYKFIIILTGLSEILRIQTQKRFDEGVVGSPSASEETFIPIGVGECRDEGDVLVKSITSSDYRDDFNSVDRNSNIKPVGSNSVILVVKKNTRILENIRENLSKWTRNNEKIEEMPLLLIDDECDNASVNTAKLTSNSINDQETEDTPSATNKLIREILVSFSRSCYVGFTATAYANIFIDHVRSDKNLERDLFPDHITFLPIYDNYIGYQRMFPEGETDSSLIKNIDDNILPDDLILQESFFEGKIRKQDLEFGDSWLPSIHEKNWKLNNGKSSDLPESLQDALHHFIISLAIKKIRKIDDDISTMLIHVSLYNNIHRQLVEHINNYLQKLKERNFSSYSKIIKKIQIYYEEEMRDNLNLEYNPNDEAIDWSEIESQLKFVLSNIDIIPMNNEYDAVHKLRNTDLRRSRIIDLHRNNPEIATQIQNYSNALKRGTNCICIGGNQLARGLTLEGLTVNYFLRDQKTGNNDTMTQMGRWFGYRDRYDDLCILFTSENLVQKFRKFSLQKENFMRRIMSMDDGRFTPRQIGLYIVMYAGINPTAKNKMRNGEQVYIQLVYDADHTYELTIETEKNDNNHKVLNNLANTIETSGISGVYNNEFDKSQEKKWFLWNEVPSNIIIDEFFNNYCEHSEQVRSGTYLKDQKSYIEKMNEFNELTKWTVGIWINGKVSNTLGEINLPNKTISYKAALRSRDKNIKKKNNGHDSWDGNPKNLKNNNLSKFYHIGSLTGPSDEMVDLEFRHSISKNKKSTEYFKYEQLLESNQSSKNPTRQFVRESRNSKYGFLGIIPIFPQKENNCEETLKPYLAYFVSYPKSDFLNKNPENIEIFGPQNYIANTVAQANQNRNLGYVYDDAS